MIDNDATNQQSSKGSGAMTVLKGTSIFNAASGLVNGALGMALWLRVRDCNTKIQSFKTITQEAAK